MKITRYAIGPSQVPVDFLADPDGVWEFDGLVEAAGFDPDQRGIAVGALIKAFRGHPPGSAVVAEVFGARVAGGAVSAAGASSREGAASLNGSAPRYSITGRYFAIVECEDVQPAVAVSSAVVSSSFAVSTISVSSPAVLSATAVSPDDALLAAPPTIVGPLSYIGARAVPVVAPSAVLPVMPLPAAELPATPRHAA